MKTAAGSDLSLGSGDYHEDGELAVMAMASFYVQIRHVFCFTFLGYNSMTRITNTILSPSIPNPQYKKYLNGRLT